MLLAVFRGACAPWRPGLDLISGQFLLWLLSSHTLQTLTKLFEHGVTWRGGLLRHELLLALLAGRVLVVFGAGHGHLGRVALLVQQLVEGVQLIALVQGREISRLQYVTTGNATQ